ncbi:MAG: CPBP family intramembrane metalloprotease [Jiangellaceae bacterium]|nr:CPBP family intramembrane metalloprotease [Jiangellaceae bacterium]
MTYAREQQTSQPARTGRVRAIVRRYPTTTFFLLAFSVTWAVWVPNVLAPDSVAGTLAPFWTYGPATAAVIVAALTGTLRDLGSRLVRWRVGWQWYAVVLLGPAAFYAALAALHAVFGWSGELDQPNAFRSGLIALLPLFLALVLTDGLGEETGWRGFALPRMLERTGPMPPSLVLGVIWALWHLPLFWTAGRPLYGEPFVIMLIELPAMSVLYTWLFQHTAGSALLAVIFHGSLSMFAVSATTQADTVRSALIILALKWALAGAVGLYWMRRSRTADVVTQRSQRGA